MAIIKKLKRLGSTIRGGKSLDVCCFDTDGNVVSSGRQIKYVPSAPGVSNVGKVWTATSSANAGWSNVPTELPAIAEGDAGKVLTVNAGETGVEWVKLYEDVTNKITPTSRITVNAINAQKVGNIITIYINATNASTTDPIPATETLLRVDQSIVPNGIAWTQSNRGNVSLNSSTRNILCGSAIGANENIIFTLVYGVS